MSSSRIIMTVVAAIAALTIGATARAQTPDPVFVRAKQLVVNGNGAAGRLLIDSVVASTTPGTPAYAEAIYWRAALAATSADAERDYRRIVVEYPGSPRSAEALLALSQLEIARGDRAGATVHMQRFLAENPGNPERARVSLQLVRMLFDQNDLGRGCSTLKTALSEVPATEVETRNQLAYYSPRCVASDVGPGGRMPMPPTAQLPTAAAGGETTGAKAGRDTAKHEGTKRDSTRQGAGAEKGNAAKEAAKYTLQIAAYKSKTDAEALVKRLKARKIDARVIGTSKPFRVRVGRYVTRAAAVAEQKTLKAKKIDAFVTEIGADDK